MVSGTLESDEASVSASDDLNFLLEEEDKAREEDLGDDEDGDGRRERPTV